MNNMKSLSLIFLCIMINLSGCIGIAASAQKTISAEICEIGSLFSPDKYTIYKRTGICCSDAIVSELYEKIKNIKQDKSGWPFSGVDFYVIFKEDGIPRIMATINSYGDYILIERLKNVSQIPGGYVILKENNSDVSESDMLSFKDKKFADYFRRKFLLALECDAEKIMNIWNKNELGSKVYEYKTIVPGEF